MIFNGFKKFKAIEDIKFGELVALDENGFFQKAMLKNNFLYRVVRFFGMKMKVKPLEEVGDNTGRIIGMAIEDSHTDEGGRVCVAVCINSESGESVILRNE